MNPNDTQMNFDVPKLTPMILHWIIMMNFFTYKLWTPLTPMAMNPSGTQIIYWTPIISKWKVKHDWMFLCFTSRIRHQIVGNIAILASKQTSASMETLLWRTLICSSSNYTKMNPTNTPITPNEDLILSKLDNCF